VEVRIFTARQKISVVGATGAARLAEGLAEAEDVALDAEVEEDDLDSQRTSLRNEVTSLCPYTSIAVRNAEG
jgi:hypothetical protein